MKSNKVAIILICSLLICLSAITAYAIAEKASTSNNDDQQPTLLDLQRRGAERSGSFLYEEKVLKGEVSPSADRMNRQSVLSATASANSFQDLLSLFESRQAYPDFVGGSGVTIIEYWLDTFGEEKVVIILEQEQVYIVTQEEDNVKTEIIYE